MLPDHCKDVSVRKVDFELTAENILAHSKNTRAYTRTAFIILRHNDETAVVRVLKADSKELFVPIIGLEIVAMPQDVIFINDDSVDVLNASQMARLATSHPGKTVVVQGMFSHISFVQGGGEIVLRVLDVVPPDPSKLSVLVEKALGSFLIEMPIVPIYEEIDLRELEKGIKTETVIFPCEASGLTSDKSVLYLDQTPLVPAEATLIGCDLSGRIFRSHYKRSIDRIEMCPQLLAPADGKKRIVKCCRVKEGFEIKDTLAVVPWGATVAEVAAAIKALLS